MQAGCVAVDSRWHVLSTGYNGAPSGMAHCDKLGCLMIEGHCLRSVHSEVNMICHAARRGVKLEDAVVFITNRPCIRCTIAMVQAGVRSIYYEGPYISEPGEYEQLQLLRRAGMFVYRMDGDEPWRLI